MAIVAAIGRMRNPALLLLLLLSCFFLIHGAHSLDAKASAFMPEVLPKNATTDGKPSGSGGNVTFVVKRGGGGGGRGGGSGHGGGGGRGSSKGSPGRGGSSGRGGGSWIPVVGASGAAGAAGSHGRRHNAAGSSCSCSLAIALATSALWAAILACR